MSAIVNEFSLKNDLGELSRLAGEVESFGEEAGLPLPGVFKLNLALDELITNIVNHGGMEASGTIDVRLSMENGLLTVEIEDQGRPFNPMQAETPDTECDMHEREVGGLGIHLTRQCMEEMHYERRGGANYLRLQRRVEQEPSKNCDQ
ncbi:MAG: ATP-binding protein [Desulfovibrionaceae bacterium]